MIEDPTFWQKIIGILWSVVVGLLWYIKQASDKKQAETERVMITKTDELQRLIVMKADRDDVEHHRQSIEEFYRENASIRKDMNGGFQRLTELLHNSHIQIMTELAKKADRG